jgi:uncharacterized protein (TIGR02231 family)
VIGWSKSGGAMTKSWILALLLVIVINFQVVAGNPELSKIKDITLYSNQALVTREAGVEVRQGVNEILISLDAFRIDPDSVTARVFGEGEILSVQYKELPVIDAPQDFIKNLVNKIETLQFSRQGLMDKKRILQNKATFLGAFLDFSQTQIPKEIQTRLPAVEDLETTLAFLDTGFGEIYSGLQSLDIELKKIDAEIKALEEELQARKGAAKENAKVIAIQFNAAKSQRIGVETQYLVRHAGWSPLYKVSVSAGLDVIDLTMFAKIIQKSGENWRSASLSISNVIPLRGVRLPSLSSWILDIPRPLARVAGRSEIVAQKSVPGAMMADEAAEVGKEPEEAAFAETEVRQLPLSFEYILPRPVDIESRDTETILPLFTKNLQGTVSHFTIPQKSLRTYLVARISADSELLPGLLNVYFGGRYVGKTQLAEKRAGEGFDLALGADRGVTVKREKTRDKVKETAFFGKVERDTVVREVAYKMTVENLKRIPAAVKVLDNIPVSRTDRIEVKDIVITPEPAVKNFNDREGVLLWNLDLAPSEKREIKIAFVVSYPKELLLPGF